MKNMKIAWRIFVALVLLGGVFIWLILRDEDELVSRIVAKRELRAFTLLKAGDVQVTPRSSASSQSDPKTDQFTGRYLLVGVKSGTEIRPEMVSDPETTSWLAKAVAVSITASAATTLGGQLQAGDWVSLIAVPTREGGKVEKFDKLIVLNVGVSKDVPAANAITVAVPIDQRDALASAMTGTQLLVTRNLPTE